MEYNENDFDIFLDDEEQARLRLERRRFNAEKLRRERRRRRIINRTIVLSAAGIIILLTVWGISSLFKSCSQSKGPGETQPSSDPSGSSSSEPENPKPSVNNEEFAEVSVSDDGTNGSFLSNIYIYKNAGYNSFKCEDGAAAAYAEAISGFAAQIKEKAPSASVYNMVVPSAAELRLPKRIAQQELESADQAEFIKTAYGSLSGVVPVNAYNALAAHNTEYIYYNTDSHWTALGAYYGYNAFAQKAGVTAADLAKMNKQAVSGFTGDLAVYSDSRDLYSNPDTVDYYEFDSAVNTESTMIAENGGEEYPVGLYYPGAESGTLSYGVFIWGDNPIFKIKTDNTAGRNIVLVKDGYGNPLAPFLSIGYDNVYVIDYRKWDGNLPEFCAENSVTDVLFLNEIANAASSAQLDTLKTLF